MTARDQHEDGHHPLPGDPREQLSALIDGALPAEQARFLLRRVQHDASLSGRWERWQLAGDVLRGGGAVALPAGFPARVAMAIAEDGRTPQAASRRWSRQGLFAAIAASVAVVALFVARPGVDGGRSAADAGATIAAMPAVEVPVSPAPSPVAEIATVPQAAAPLQVADAGAPRPPRSGPRTPAMPSAPPATEVAGIATSATPDMRVAGVQSTGAEASPAEGGASPFGAPALPDDRPWPRAALPGVSGDAPFTVGHATGHALGTDGARPFAPTRWPMDAPRSEDDADSQ
jgi:negative regulator of sigma E activity